MDAMAMTSLPFKASLRNNALPVLIIFEILLVLVFAGELKAFSFTLSKQNANIILQNPSSLAFHEQLQEGYYFLQKMQF